MKKLLVVVAGFGFAAGTLFAQEIPNRLSPPPHFQPRSHKGGDPIVEQLKLSHAQKEQLKKEHEKALEKVLTPEQKTKLKELRQEQAVRKQSAEKKKDEKLKQELGITDAQLTKLKNLQTEFKEKMKTVREDVNQTVQQQRDRTRELITKQQQALKELLNSEQLEKYKKMMQDKMRHLRQGGKEGMRPMEGARGRKELPPHQMNAPREKRETPPPPPQI